MKYQVVCTDSRDYIQFYKDFVEGQERQMLDWIKRQLGDTRNIKVSVRKWND